MTELETISARGDTDREIFPSKDLAELKREPAVSAHDTEEITKSLNLLQSQIQLQDFFEQMPDRDADPSGRRSSSSRYDYYIYQ